MLAVKQLEASVMFTSLVDVAVHGLHLSTLLRGGLLGCSSNPKTTPVGCVPCSALYPTHTHTNASFCNLHTSLAGKQVSVGVLTVYLG